MPRPLSMTYARAYLLTARMPTQVPSRLATISDCHAPTLGKLYMVDQRHCIFRVAKGSQACDEETSREEYSNQQDDLQGCTRHWAVTYDHSPGSSKDPNFPGCKFFCCATAKRPDAVAVRTPSTCSLSDGS